jgi:hypothetical protein
MARPGDGFGAMIIEVTGDPPETKAAADSGAKSPMPDQPAAPAGGATTDEMSECSFPASDPPSVWTWEVNATAKIPKRS